MDGEWLDCEKDNFYALFDHATRIESLAAIRRMRASLDASETLLLAAMAADPDPYRDGTTEAMSKEWVREDVACALRVPPVTATSMLHTATTITTRFPAMLAAMRDGTPNVWLTPPTACPMTPRPRWRPQSW